MVLEINLQDGKWALDSHNLGYTGSPARPSASPRLGVPLYELDVAGNDCGPCSTYQEGGAKTRGRTNGPGLI